MSIDMRDVADEVSDLLEMLPEAVLFAVSALSPTEFVDLLSLLFFSIVRPLYKLIDHDERTAKFYAMSHYFGLYLFIVFFSGSPLVGRWATKEYWTGKRQNKVAIFICAVAMMILQWCYPIRKQLRILEIIFLFGMVITDKDLPEEPRDEYGEIKMTSKAWAAMAAKSLMIGSSSLAFMNWDMGVWTFLRWLTAHVEIPFFMPLEEVEQSPWTPGMRFLSRSSLGVAMISTSLLTISMMTAKISFRQIKKWLTLHPCPLFMNVFRLVKFVIKQTLMAWTILLLLLYASTELTTFTKGVGLLKDVIFSDTNLMDGAVVDLRLIDAPGQDFHDRCPAENSVWVTQARCPAFESFYSIKCPVAEQIEEEGSWEQGFVPGLAGVFRMARSYYNEACTVQGALALSATVGVVEELLSREYVTERIAGLVGMFSGCYTAVSNMRIPKM